MSSPRPSPRLASPFAVLLVLCSLGFVATACEGPVDFTHTTKFPLALNLNGKFAGEAGTTATEDLGPVLILYQVPVDLATQNPELVDYAESGLFTESGVDQITYKVISNTANIDMTNIQLAIGPTEATSLDAENTFLIATIDEIKAGDTPTGMAEVFPDNAAPIATQVQTLKFAIVSGTDVSVNAGDPIPSGAVQMDVEMLMHFVADPL